MNWDQWRWALCDLIVILVLWPCGASAQVATDDEIARAWAVCAPMEASGSLAAQLKAKGIPPWRTGYENCAAVKVAYEKSKAGIDAKAAADRAAADKAAVDALAGRLTGGKK